MIKSKSDIKKIALFEFEGQLVASNIKLVTNWIDKNIQSYYDNKLKRSEICWICWGGIILLLFRT